MNEQFKFRVYDKTSKEYTYSDELGGGLGAFFDYCEKIKADAEQFIQMYDSLGVLIYEKDVMRLPDSDDNSECSVEMHEGAYRHKFNWGYSALTMNQNDLSNIGWTVIGHTHQNTESSEE